MQFSDIDVAQIRQSGFFDAEWYCSNYPDVPQLAMDPLNHYLQVGWLLGRNPSAQFDTNAYLALHKDVAATAINPLWHYIKWGQAENRSLLDPAIAAEENLLAYLEHKLQQVPEINSPTAKASSQTKKLLEHYFIQTRQQHVKLQQQEAQ